MTLYYPELRARVRHQRESLPAVYGDIDFDELPYRFATEPDASTALPNGVGDREEILADEKLVELIGTATMLGDVDADPYAALTASRSVTELIAMLRRACRNGIGAVPDAPPELRRFIAAMEATPDWIDMDLVEKGAARARMSAALIAPFVTRGAFIATFTNSYAALPMVITGALSGRRAAHRVNETSAFFAVTTLPGAMRRDGKGFEAAAMVRLMHSMVRVNAMTKTGDWDSHVYGVPIPQVDQMPAGMINLYLISRAALRSGRTEFGTGERALVEFARYRCFLLGLPVELVPSTPREIVTMFHARGALLRAGFDDRCRALVSSTMAAYLRADDSRFDRAADAVERSYSKVAFVQAFCEGNRRAGERMGVSLGVADYLRVAVTAPFIGGRVVAITAAGRRNRLAPMVDRYLTGLVRKRLASYGDPDFRTDAADYAHADS
ncbi:DUF2236 domain-containing protein [Gordonia sp. X0973]|uniref:oxygenase MpaB family protein n=1 Tax=Gordonia sp. X0973 TaxID=2742602 RepID=UPI000F5375B6|nr:oxygenase MpaB family protein [Gordonia sp. X0973]QKT08657.1 DUF2236 domain-containing protein [Gordonia sp. X0973]